ncbi:MAG: hypothetical protein MUE52_14310 [Tabrizicola sp.]|jgi:hypothetical protein|nr:hypothetical protein [Tabrizicola sp.]
MTIRITDGGVSDQDVLAVAEGLYREAAIELFRAIEAIRAGEFTEIKAAHTAIRDLRTAAQQALEERGKVDKLRKQIAGQVGAGGALDFDGARAEIGRRLACLRDAGGGG